MAINGEQVQTNCRIGEVVEASTAEFTAQCYRLYDAPAIGSLVICGEQAQAYGVVCAASTQSIDPGRAAIPRGEYASTEEEVLSSNPQIERLLHTKFRAVIVGYRDAGAIRRYPPAERAADVFVRAGVRWRGACGVQRLARVLRDAAERTDGSSRPCGGVVPAACERGAS